MVFRVRRIAVAFFFSGVTAIALWLCWRCRHDPAIRFLPKEGPATWIVYPNPPDILAHPITNSNGSAVGIFRRSFFLEQGPTDAQLQIRALETFSVRINGEEARGPTSLHWKEITRFSVGSALRSGTNQIEISVTNRAGPPLLWLSLTAGNEQIVSDRGWEASLAEAIWQPVQLADKPRSFRPGDLLREETSLVESLRRKSVTHVGCFLLTLGITLFARRWKETPQWRLTAREAQRLGLGLLIAGWVVLFIHNANQLTVRHGFDSSSHLSYIKSIQERHGLPQADEQWETHQQPLYYLFAAGLLEIVQWDSATPMGILFLRIVSMLFGIGQILLVFASLLLVFADELKRPLIGAAMAAFLPAHIYHAHYVTNETFFALLASGVFYLTLRVLRSERSHPLWLGALGLCLGAALLSKLTAVLLVPVVFVALTVKAIEHRAVWKQWFGAITLCGGICLLVAGWYFWPMWQSGGPWSQSRWAYGIGWWQEDGYRTAGYYFRFGESLFRPLFSGFHSFWDGIYSTLWGDGLCGGATSVDFRPPWNYELLALGYWLALLPTTAMLIASGRTLWNLVRHPAPEWLLLFGAVLLFAPALFYFSLVGPGASQVRASFGLMLLVPFCALFALGFERFASLRNSGSVLAVAITIAWALNSWSAHWISSSSAQTQLSRAKMFLEYGHFAAAAREAEEGLRREPSKSSLRSILADSWNQLGKTNQARELVHAARTRWTNDPVAHLDAGFDLAQAGRVDEAILETRAAIALAPDHPMARRELVLLLAGQKRFAEAEQACREALRVSPYNPQLREWLANLRAGQTIANGGESIKGSGR